MKKVIIALAVIALAVGGCIVTGNLYIEIDIGDFPVNAGQSFASAYVDLNNYSEYVDHKEDLNSVDDMGFVCRVTNTGANPATGQIWVSNTSSTTSAVKDVLLLDGIVVAPGQTKEITLEESYDYLAEFTAARDVILAEKFTAYAVTTTAPFTLQVKDMVILLSINGKP